MRTALILAASLLAAPAFADTISIEMDDAVETQTMKFDCAGKAVDVTYYNSGDASIVVLDLDDTRIIASNVIAASGARYAGNKYIWWTTGDDADLYDLMDGGEDKPIACKATS